MISPPPGLARLGALAMALGVAGCFDTADNCSKRTAAYLVNATHADINMDIQRVSQPLDCAAVEKDPLGQLPRSAFEDRQPLTVPPMERTLLDRIIPVSTRYVDDVCDAVLVSAAGMADTVLFWHEGNRAEFPAYPQLMRSEPERNAVYIERVGQDLVLTGTVVRVIPLE